MLDWHDNDEVWFTVRAFDAPEALVSTACSRRSCRRRRRELFRATCARSRRSTADPLVLMPMAGALPLGDPVPARRLAARLGHDRCGDRASGCTCTSRSAGCGAATATSTPTRRMSCAARGRTEYADTLLREVELAATRARGRRPERPARRCSSAAARPTLLPPADLGRMLDGVRDGVRPRRRRRGHHRGEPRHGRRRRCLAELAAAGFTRLSIGMQSAVPPRARRARPHARPARMSDRRRAARRAGLDVSLDLIYGAPGESLDGLGRVAGRRDRARTRPHLGLRAHRRRRERSSRVRSAGATVAEPDDDLAGRHVRARRRTLLARQRASTGTRSATGPRDARGQPHRPAQPRVLARRGLVGDRPRRAQPHRRRALVEREASRRVRPADRRGRLTRRRPRDAGRRPARARERAAAVADPRRAAARRRARRGAPRRGTRSSPTDSSTARRRSAARSC